MFLAYQCIYAIYIFYSPMLIYTNWKSAIGLKYTCTLLFLYILVSHDLGGCEGGHIYRKWKVEDNERETVIEEQLYSSGGTLNI